MDQNLNEGAQALTDTSGRFLTFREFLAVAYPTQVDPQIEKDVEKRHRGLVGESVLTTSERDSLKDSDFALPGRRYPIHDETHARDALSRVSENGTAEEKEEVRRKVKEKYPNIQVSA